MDNKSLISVSAIVLGFIGSGCFGARGDDGGMGSGGATASGGASTG